MRRVACIIGVALALLGSEALAKGSSGRSGFGGPRVGRGRTAGGSFRRSARPTSRMQRAQRSRTTSPRAAPSRGRQPRASGTIARRPRTSRPTARTAAPTRSRSEQTAIGRANGGRTYRTRTDGRSSREGGFTRRSAPERGSGMTTREYLNRRFDTTRSGVRGGSARASSNRGEGRHAGHRPGHRPGGAKTTGYRQPTIGPGYSDLFPGTGGPPVKGDCRYYRPCYHKYRGCYWGFYYPRPIAYAYVPYGFYGGGTSIYIDAAGKVGDEYVIEEVEEEQPAPADRQEVESAAGSAAAERYMREATELFREKEYPEAARRFRLAAIAAPERAGPLFALGQALVALENYPYAAKVTRQAIDLEPALLREGGDLGSVYKDREEFERIQKRLKARVADRPDDVHARFLLGVAQYFSGDPEARSTLSGLAADQPTDRIARDLAKAAAERFAKADELPEIE